MNKSDFSDMYENFFQSVSLEPQNPNSLIIINQIVLYTEVLSYNYDADNLELSKMSPAFLNS